jgi:hypothetical protein
MPLDLDRPAPPSSFLAKAGAVALTTVGNVPTRMVLWGLIGLVVGIVGVVLSYVLGALVMGRGAMILGYLVTIPAAIPPCGAVLFGLHGLHRGAARAALALEKKFGLVAHVVDRVMAGLGERYGERLANLPLQQLEVALKEIVVKYLSAKDDDEGRGLAAYVVRRARVTIVARIETCLLAAYREELAHDGAGGGVSLAKLRARVSGEISGRLGELVMSPLNKQLAVFMTLYVLFAAGWWFWLFLLLMVVGTIAGSGGAG